MEAGSRGPPRGQRGAVPRPRKSGSYSEKGACRSRPQKPLHRLHAPRVSDAALPPAGVSSIE